MRKTLLLVSRITTNKYKNTFLVRLGTNLAFKNFGIMKPPKSLGFILRAVTGFLIEIGVYKIELTMDSISEGRKLSEFREEAYKAYKETTKKVYSEEEKIKIREEYLGIIEKIGSVGVKPT